MPSYQWLSPWNLIGSGPDPNGQLRPRRQHPCRRHTGRETSISEATDTSQDIPTQVEQVGKRYPRPSHLAWRTTSTRPITKRM